MDRHLVLVTGSPRSGTSLFTGMLRALGAHVPQPEIEPDDSNPRGFAEPRFVVDFHARMLRSAGVHVTDARPSAWARTAELGRHPRPRRELERWVRRELRDGPVVAVKDPRLVWFLPLWHRVGESHGGARTAIVVRHPVEVIRSQQTYYVPWHANSRAGGWLNAMLFAERSTRGQLRAFVRYADLLDDWMAVLARACDDLGVPLVDRAAGAQMRAVNQLVDPSLRRSGATWGSRGVHPRLVDLAEQAWCLLGRLQEEPGGDVPALHAELDALRDEYVGLYELGETLTESTLFAAQHEARGLLQVLPRYSPHQPALTPATAAAKVVARARRALRRWLHGLRRGSR
jgi:hypothetical protein